MFFNNDKVITGPVVLTWDGLRNPEKRQSGSMDYNVSVLIPANAPELVELRKIVADELAASEFRGVLPPGGHTPFDRPADPAKFGPQYAGYLVVKAGSSRGVCPIVDASGNELDPMTYGPMLYPGCIMQLLVGAYAYNNVNKGVSLTLAGIKIVDSTAPALPVGNGMSAGEVANAFGGGGATAAPTPAPAPAGPGQAPAAPSVSFTQGPQMTPQAQYSYDAYKKAGWTDEQLVANGLMVG